MAHRRFAPALASVALFVLAGCGDDTSSSSGGGGEAGATSSSTSTAGEGGAGTTSSAGTGETTATGAGGGGTGFTRADLLGTWETVCYLEINATTVYGRVGMTFTETSIEYRYEQWEGDPTCSDDGARMLLAESTDSSWSLGAVAESGATELDSVVGSRVITTLSDFATTSWNQGSGCGPFTTGVPVEVTGQTCYGYAYPQPGGSVYQTVFPDPEGFRLGLASNGDGLTPETRAVVPEMHAKGLYIRQ